MELGFNVNIECKGIGREYEMSFEASARRIKQPEEDEVNYILNTYATQYHAVGFSIEEIAVKLLKQIDEVSK